MKITNAKSTAAYATSYDIDYGIFGTSNSFDHEAFSKYQAANAQPAESKRRMKRQALATYTIVEGVGMSVNKLTEDIRRRLDDFVSELQGLNIEKIDLRGFDRYYWQMGSSRAIAIKKYLSSKGIDANLMVAKGAVTNSLGRGPDVGKTESVQIRVYGKSKADNVAQASLSEPRSLVALLLV